MFKKITIVVMGLLIVFIGLVASRPSEFRVSRSANMGVPAEKVFAQVNNLHNWESWSPWAKIDPKALNSYSGPDAGVGASFSWAGNQDVGEGRMTIIESKPNELIRFRMEFLAPFQATNTAEFTFVPNGDQAGATQIMVTWSMFGTNNFIGKAIGLIFDCDKMVGDQFEKGLVQLEAQAKK